MIIADLHTHTNHSHAVDSVSDMVRAARQKGLKYYGISEHSPRPAGYTYPSDYQAKLLATYQDYINEVCTFRNKSDEDFGVLLGLEVDYMPDRHDFAVQSVQAYDFDYIIGGLHFQKTWGFDGSQADWDKLKLEERYTIYNKYYKDLTQMCEDKLVDIVAHPDLVKLFSIDSFREWLKIPESIALIKNLFNVMYKNDIIMEVSSAGLRKSCCEIYPGPQIMELAKEIGLKICISSDAHATDQIAYAFDELEKYVKQFGYTESYIVIKRQKKVLPFS